MHPLRISLATGAMLAFGFMIAGAERALAQEKKETKAKVVWTDTKDPSLPRDFAFQGEFTGEIQGGEKLGCQVIALANGAFQAVLLPGGLPGAGWDGKNKILLDGKLDGGKVEFKAASGEKKYLAGPPATFSATSKFPPVGQKDCSATGDAESITGKTDDGKAFTLKKTIRQSPTMGAKPPEGALVLFDGSNTDEFKGGRIDKETGFLNTDGADIATKKSFGNYILHVEFMLPYRPDGRGQGRGNSGVYMVDMYECQVLDSFGLDGKNNECGGFYTKAEPKVNMCLPPLVWQTYDFDFTNAVAENGKKVSSARATVKHNGVVIHDNVEITGPTGGGRSAAMEGTPGLIKLQGHGNPLQYRNIWIVEKK